MERIDTGLDATSRAELLYRNRRRCCTCRNPAKAVGFYAVSTDQPRHLENLVVLCADCYILTLSCAQESGENSVKREVIAYKKTWERLCQVWRDESTRRITVKQGARTWQYDSDAYIAYIGSYYLDDGGEMVLEIKSDELVNIQITKGDSVRSRVRYADAYEFNISFTAQRADYYSLFIESKSEDPVTVDLAVSTFLDVARKQEAALTKLKRSSLKRSVPAHTPHPRSRHLMLNGFRGESCRRASIPSQT